MNNASNTSSQPEPTHRPKRPFFHRREILVLLAIWLVGCSLVAALMGVFYLYGQRPPPGGPPPAPNQPVTIVFEGGTAKTAYLAALKQAQGWHSPLELVSLSASWPNASLDSLGQAETWDFSFFSGEHERLYFVVVATDKLVVGRPHPFKLKRPPRLVNPAEWAVDSDQALSIWLNNGGGAFVQTFPENQVEILLRRDNNSNKPIWNIIGVTPDQSQLLYMTIDAMTGAILNRN